MRLEPEEIEAITALAFAEMLEGGFTRVAEFHYLHNDPAGRPYADPAELTGRIVAAAQAPYQIRRGLGVVSDALAGLPDWARGATRHAVTMTAELSALFDDRPAGVAALAAWYQGKGRAQASVPPQRIKVPS